MKNHKEKALIGFLIAIVVLSLSVPLANAGEFGRSETGFSGFLRDGGSVQLQDDIKLKECKFYFNSPTLSGFYEPTSDTSAAYSSGGIVFSHRNKNTELGQHDNWEAPGFWQTHALNTIITLHPPLGPSYSAAPLNGGSTQIPLIKVREGRENLLYFQCDYNVGDRKLEFLFDETYLTIYSTQEFDSNLGSVEEGYYKSDAKWWFEPIPHGPVLNTRYEGLTSSGNTRWDIPVPEWESEGYKRVNFGGYSYINDGVSHLDEEPTGFFPNTQPSERWAISLDGIPTSLVELRHEIRGTNGVLLARAVMPFYIQNEDEDVVRHLVPQEPIVQSNNKHYQYLSGDFDDGDGNVYWEYDRHMETISGHEIGFYPTFYNPFIHTLKSIKLVSNIFTDCLKMPQLCARITYANDVDSSSRPSELPYSPSRSQIFNNIKSGEYIDFNYYYARSDWRKDSSVIGLENTLQTDHPSFARDKVYTLNGLRGTASAYGWYSMGSSSTNSYFGVQREYNIGSETEQHIAVMSPDPYVGLVEENGVVKLTFEMDIDLTAATGAYNLNPGHQTGYPNKHNENNLDTEMWNYVAEFNLYKGDCRFGELIGTQERQPSAVSLEASPAYRISVEGPSFVTDDLENGDYCIKPLIKRKNDFTKYAGKYMAVPPTSTIFKWEKPLSVAVNSDQIMHFYPAEFDQDNIKGTRIYNPTFTVKDSSTLENHFLVLIDNVVDQLGVSVMDKYDFYINDVLLVSVGEQIFYDVSLQPLEGKDLVLRVENKYLVDEDRTDSFDVKVIFSANKDNDKYTSEPLTYTMIHSTLAPDAWFDIVTDELGGYTQAPADLEVRHAEYEQGKTLADWQPGDQVIVIARWTIQGSTEGYDAHLCDTYKTRFGIYGQGPDKPLSNNYEIRTNRVRECATGGEGSRSEVDGPGTDTRRAESAPITIPFPGTWTAFINIDWENDFTETLLGGASGENNNLAELDFGLGESFSGEGCLIHTGDKLETGTCYSDPNDASRALKKCYFLGNEYVFQPVTDCSACVPTATDYKDACDMAYPNPLERTFCSLTGPQETAICKQEQKWFDITGALAPQIQLEVTHADPTKSLSQWQPGDQVAVNTYWTLAGNFAGYLEKVNLPYRTRIGIYGDATNPINPRPLTNNLKWFDNWVRPSENEPQAQNKMLGENTDTRYGKTLVTLTIPGEYTAFMNLDAGEINSGSGPVIDDEITIQGESGETNNLVELTFSVGLQLNDVGCDFGDEAGQKIGVGFCYVSPNDENKVIQICTSDTSNGGVNYVFEDATSCSQCAPSNTLEKTACIIPFPNTYCKEGTNNLFCEDIPNACEGITSCSAYDTQQSCDTTVCEFITLPGECEWVPNPLSSDGGGTCADIVTATCTVPGTTNEVVVDECYYDDSDADTGKLQVCTITGEWTDATCDQCSTSSESCPTAIPWCQDNEVPQCSMYPEDDYCTDNPNASGCFEGKSCNSLLLTGCDGYGNDMDACTNDLSVCNFGACMWDEPSISCTLDISRFPDENPTVREVVTWSECDFGIRTKTTIRSSVETNIELSRTTIDDICPADTIKLPFFTFVNILLVLAILVAIYTIILKRR